ncbi:peroxiredoxin-like family protein [Bradyrhizobium sp. Ash2021]|jgi:peroxiredoxin|uniref:peroxiredoxin-like family protein n=1 Tax=Bradyrhizobium sp. Ash2021 TaxID=2954771 RepID=UPI00281602EC|nr:peroxiredoxin-like family protein [Bradyrhizobium sp. Ash2021]WMT79455.1 AhpC/TSA family protein [Bradyrhizobium sp. Ash2021]
MGLEQDLADFKAEFELTAPAGRAALYNSKVEELRAKFPLSGVLKVGDLAPDFSLPNAIGSYTSLEDVLKGGAAVVTFYRGGWCPYCNLQLRAYQAALPDIEALGARMLAISPQLPDKSLSTSEKNALKFPVLSDVRNSIARKFGLVYSLPEELRAALRSNGKELPGINGDESWELPVPATFVVDGDRRVVFSFVEIDYRRRLAPEDLVSALRSIAAARESAS